MSDEQRSSSWIRTPEKVLSIADAEAEVVKTEPAIKKHAGCT
jgi:hypothetical protein